MPQWGENDEVMRQGNTTIAESAKPDTWGQDDTILESPPSFEDIAKLQEISPSNGPMSIGQQLDWAQQPKYPLWQQNILSIPQQVDGIKQLEKLADAETNFNSFLETESDRIANEYGSSEHLLVAEALRSGATGQYVLGPLMDMLHKKMPLAGDVDLNDPVNQLALQKIHDQNALSLKGLFNITVSQGSTLIKFWAELHALKTLGITLRVWKAGEFARFGANAELFGSHTLLNAIIERWSSGETVRGIGASALTGGLLSKTGGGPLSIPKTAAAFAGPAMAAEALTPGATPETVKKVGREQAAFGGLFAGIPYALRILHPTGARALGELKRIDPQAYQMIAEQLSTTAKTVLKEVKNDPAYMRGYYDYVANRAQGKVKLIEKAFDAGDLNMRQVQSLMKIVGEEPMLPDLRLQEMIENFKPKKPTVETADTIIEAFERGEINTKQVDLKMKALQERMAQKPPVAPTIEAKPEVVPQHRIAPEVAPRAQLAAPAELAPPIETPIRQQPNAEVQAAAEPPKIEQVERITAQAETAPFMLRPSQMELRPQQMQYKRNPPRIRGKWNKDWEGHIDIWFDRNTKTWVVINGHRRVNERLFRGDDDPMVVIPHKAANAIEAKLIGAEINIRQGQGEASDAAKLYREAGMTLERVKEQNLDISEGHTRKGMALASLEQNLYEGYQQGEIPESVGVMIGELVPKGPVQTQIYKEYLSKQGRTKHKLSDDEVANVIKLAKTAGKITKTEIILWGKEEETVLALDEKARLLTWLQREVGKQANAFGEVIKKGRADLLARGGNIIDVEQSKGLAKQADIMKFYIDQMAHYTGPFNDLLNKYAGELVNGGDINVIRERFFKEFRNYVNTGAEPGTVELRVPTETTEGIGTPTEGGLFGVAQAEAPSPTAKEALALLKAQEVKPKAISLEGDFIIGDKPNPKNTEALNKIAKSLGIEYDAPAISGEGKTMVYLGEAFHDKSGPYLVVQGASVKNTVARQKLDRGFAPGSTILFDKLLSHLKTRTDELVSDTGQVSADTMEVLRRMVHKWRVYVESLGPSGKIIGINATKITHRTYKQSNADLWNSRKLYKDLSKDERVILGKFLNHLDSAKNAPQNIKAISKSFRRILDRIFIDANKVGMTRPVAGRELPVAGSGKPVPEMLNPEGVRWFKRLVKNGISDPEIAADLLRIAQHWDKSGQGLAEDYLPGFVQDKRAYQREAQKTGKGNWEPEDVMAALKSWRQHSLRTSNKYLEGIRLEMPDFWQDKYLEFDPEVWLPGLLRRNWMAVEAMRVWGPGRGAKSFPVLQEHINNIRREYGPEKAEFVQSYIEDAFAHTSSPSQRLSSELRRYQFISKYAFSFPGQLQNWMDGFAKASTVGDLSTLLRTLHVSKAEKEYLFKSGAIFTGESSMLQGISQEKIATTLGGRIVAWTQSRTEYRIAKAAKSQILKDIQALAEYPAVENRIVSFLNGIWRYPLGKSKTALMERLKVLGDKEFVEYWANEVASGKPLAPEVLEEAIYRTVRNRSFPRNLDTNPGWWARHPAWQSVLQYRTFSIENMYHIWRDAVKYTVKTGDVSRLAQFIVTQALVGEIYTATMDYLNDRDKSVIYALTQKDNRNLKEISWRIVNDFKRGVGVNLVGIWVYGGLDFAMGVSGRTAFDIVSTGADIVKTPKLTPTALNQLLKRQIVPYRQLTTTLDKIGKKYLGMYPNDMANDYFAARNKAAEWVKEQEGTASELGQALETVFMGQWRKRGENTLPFEMAQRNIMLGEIDTAAKFLSATMTKIKTMEDLQNTKQAILTAMQRTSPLGQMPDSKKLRFADSMPYEDWEKIIALDYKYKELYGQAIIKAAKETLTPTKSKQIEDSMHQEARLNKQALESLKAKARQKKGAVTQPAARYVPSKSAKELDTEKVKQARKKEEELLRP